MVAPSCLSSCDQSSTFPSAHGTAAADHNPGATGPSQDVCFASVLPSALQADGVLVRAHMVMRCCAGRREDGGRLRGRRHLRRRRRPCGVSAVVKAQGSAPRCFLYYLNLLDILNLVSNQILLILYILCYENFILVKFYTVLSAKRKSQRSFFCLLC